MRGRPAELLSSSHAPGRLEQPIMGFIKALLALDVGLVAVVLVNGTSRDQTWINFLPFAVIPTVVAVSVALSTTSDLGKRPQLPGARRAG